MTPHRLYVGTIGEGLFRSDDLGQSFMRVCEGMFVECHVRALAVHPEDNRLYLGSEMGLFVSRDGADSWRQLPARLDGMQVWSILLLPHQPNVILVGTRPGRIFRSSDGGETWREAETRMVKDCPRILHTRVTCLAADPDIEDRVWAGVEIDGLHRSTDAGATWEPVGQGLSSRDIHALAIVPRAFGRRFLAATNNDLNASDDGEMWTPLKIGET